MKTRQGRRIGSPQVGASAEPTESAERQETLRRLRRWYAETNNHLYAWEAIARCLISDCPPTIPEWCFECLRSAAVNLTSLSWGTDFRTRQPLSADQAIELVAAALLLTRQGKRNAFASLLKDREDMRDAIAIEFKRDLVQEIARRRNITKDRAQRIITKGRRLVGDR